MTQAWAIPKSYREPGNDERSWLLRCDILLHDEHIHRHGNPFTLWSSNWTNGRLGNEVTNGTAEYWYACYQEQSRFSGVAITRYGTNANNFLRTVGAASNAYWRFNLANLCNPFNHVDNDLRVCRWQSLSLPVINGRDEFFVPSGFVIMSNRVHVKYPLEHNHASLYNRLVCTANNTTSFTSPS